MRNKILFVGLLSTTMFSYAQDSLSVQKTSGNISDKQVSDNNIRHIPLRTSSYQSVHSTLNATQYCENRNHETTNNDFSINDWNSSWFINAAAGASAFVGEPIGCEDLFGRSLPMYHISVGKWFNHSAGGRIAFQGFKLKNHLLERQNYYHTHADFLLNATNLFHQGHSPAFWQVIPFAGAGIIQNNTTHKHPFTLNYGILNQFRLSNFFSLSLELGGLTTFGDFDGAGKGNKFTDHLFHLSAGFTITLGQKEWNYSSATRSHLHNSVTIQGNIPLEPTDLAERSVPADTTNTGRNSYPQNNYSGLNSLRERLTGTSSEEAYPYQTEWFGQPDTLASTSDTISTSPIKKLQSITWEYLNQLTDRKAPVGAPILFFFKIGTFSLTDTSQSANLDAIATVCRKFNLLLNVTGYADSATGNAVGNSALSEERARYITTELTKRGMEEKSITSKGEGGIAIYSPNEVNRCVKVEIFLNR